MEYTKKDLGSFGLHLIKTDKFKTITVRVVFHTPVIKKDITKRNILSDILLQSSACYDSRRNMSIAAEELYAAEISNSNQRLGNYVITCFNLQVLHDKYTEEGNFEKSVEFLSNIIFKPDIEEKKFKSDKLDIVKTNAKIALNSIKEDATNYSLIRMAEAYDNEGKISYRMMGYLEDIDLITEENLYEYYKNMIDKDYVDIFIVGDIDEKESLSIIKKYFKFQTVKKKKEKYELDIIKPRKKKLIAKETINNQQSKLAIACPISELTQYERDYALVLANLILGGGTDSKLFKEVREANSLCYTIHSFTNKLDNLLVITSGIDKDNYKQAVDLISNNLQDMKKGKFTDNDIMIAKEFYKTTVDAIEENEFHILNEYLSREILKTEPLQERARKILSVRKQDIMKVSKKIVIDTIFLLEGVKHEEN